MQRSLRSRCAAPRPCRRDTARARRRRPVKALCPSTPRRHGDDSRECPQARRGWPPERTLKALRGPRRSTPRRRAAEALAGPARRWALKADQRSMRLVLDDDLPGRAAEVSEGHPSHHPHAERARRDHVGLRQRLVALNRAWGHVSARHEARQDELADVSVPERPVGIEGGRRARAAVDLSSSASIASEPVPSHCIGASPSRLRGLSPCSARGHRCLRDEYQRLTFPHRYRAPHWLARRVETRQICPQSGFEAWCAGPSERSCRRSPGTSRSPGASSVRRGGTPGAFATEALAADSTAADRPRRDGPRQPAGRCGRPVDAGGADLGAPHGRLRPGAADAAPPRLDDAPSRRTCSAACCLAVQRGLGRMPARLAGARRRARPPPARRVRRAAHPPGSRPRRASLDDAYLFARLDAIVDCADPRWDRTLSFLEPNVVGVGGTRYHGARREGLDGRRAARACGVPGILPATSTAAASCSITCSIAPSGHWGPGPGAPRPGGGSARDLRDQRAAADRRVLHRAGDADGARRRPHPRAPRRCHSALRRRARRWTSSIAFPEIRELEEARPRRACALDALWRCFADGPRRLDPGRRLRPQEHLRADDLGAASTRSSPTRIGARSAGTCCGPGCSGTAAPTCSDGTEVDLLAQLRPRPPREPGAQAESQLRRHRGGGGPGDDRGRVGPDARRRGAWPRPARGWCSSYRPLPRERASRCGSTARWTFEERLNVSGLLRHPAGRSRPWDGSPRRTVVNLSRPGSALVPQVRTG